MTCSDVSPARKPGISRTGAPSPRGTPSPRNTGWTTRRASSACQRTSPTGLPHQRRAGRGRRPGGSGSNAASCTASWSASTGSGRAVMGGDRTRGSGSPRRKRRPPGGEPTRAGAAWSGCRPCTAAVGTPSSSHGRIRRSPRHGRRRPGPRGLRGSQEASTAAPSGTPGTVAGWVKRCDRGNARPGMTNAGQLEPRDDRPQLADREDVLALLSRRIAEPGRSLAEPRPEEPPVDARLAARLREGLPEHGEEPADVLDDAVRVLDASVSPARPLYLAYIGSTGLEVGVLGEALAATYDVNLAVTAGGADLVERQALGWVAAFVGYPHSFGAFTSGGMTSNLTALLAAREKALPGTRHAGLFGQAGAVYCSDEAHHSIMRAVEACGLGSDYLRRLPLDDLRRMRPGDLDAAIAADRRAGVTPVAVV